MEQGAFALVSLVASPDDFVKAIVDWLADGFESKKGIGLLQDRQALQRLTEAVEKAKTELLNVQPFITAHALGPQYTEESAKIELFNAQPFITADALGPKHTEDSAKIEPFNVRPSSPRTPSARSTPRSRAEGEDRAPQRAAPAGPLG